MQLLNGASSTGAGAVASTGERLLTVAGVFNGATVTVQYQASDGTWINLVGASFAAAAVRTLSVPVPMILRGAISGAGGSTSINLDID